MPHTREKNAKVLQDGRVHHSAVVHPDDSRTSYHWECICHPDDKHDHEKQHANIAERLVARDVVLDALGALVGKHRITDANIQIWGPERWDLYVAWMEGDNRVEYRQSLSHPKNCPTPRLIEDMVRKSTLKYYSKLADAVQAVRVFK